VNVTVGRNKSPF